ncbi:hypothetical protein QBC34DRAFT_130139 [Podospora aff. communis PSN243]|uniref:Uncharacterized protein n=1 Tax=Podospora aff. communis PSN243 TaxID=3040156 RepID=A0AAV9GH47_9PEZI|nr:hypothetical protein QBC34DRAFT_130139 [Podospora aff. communis PSN243]
MISSKRKFPVLHSTWLSPQAPEGDLSYVTSQQQGPLLSRSPLRQLRPPSRVFTASCLRSLLTPEDGSVPGSQALLQQRLSMGLRSFCPIQAEGLQCQQQHRRVSTIRLQCIQSRYASRFENRCPIPKGDTKKCRRIAALTILPACTYPAERWTRPRWQHSKMFAARSRKLRPLAPTNRTSIRRCDRAGSAAGESSRGLTWQPILCMARRDRQNTATNCLTRTTIHRPPSIKPRGGNNCITRSGCCAIAARNLLVVALSTAEAPPRARSISNSSSGRLVGSQRGCTILHNRRGTHHETSFRN